MWTVPTISFAARLSKIAETLKRAQAGEAEPAAAAPDAPLEISDAQAVAVRAEQQALRLEVKNALSQVRGGQEEHGVENAQYACPNS